MSKSGYQEIEGKFLDVNPADIEKRLIKLGAKKQFRRKFRVYVFDHPDLRLHKNKSWVRIRDEGDKITFGFKQRLGVVEGKQDQSMHETEVEVSNFEDTAQILRASGLIDKFCEEKWRTLYTLDDIEFCVDEMPMIPPYLEIEASSWDSVKAAAKQLGFDPKDMLICSAYQIYEHYGISQLDYDMLTFKEQRKRQK